MPRSKGTLNQGTVAKIKVFLKNYGETCNIVEAAKKSGMNRELHYEWIRTKPGYRAAFERTQHLAREVLESELASRAIAGWVEPVFYQGVKCGSVRRFDGSTGMALLRGMWPEKYGIQRQEISGPQGSPVQARIEIVFVKPEPEASASS